MFWQPDTALEPDTYAAFRATFELAEAMRVEFHLCAVSWFGFWLDGELRAHGPARFSPGKPDYDKISVDLPAGRHVIGMQLHYEGVDSRMMTNEPAFLFCRIHANGREIVAPWRTRPLPAYRRQVRRLSPAFGWSEWCDTRDEPFAWQAPSFDDTEWSAVTDRGKTLESASILPSVPLTEHRLHACAHGALVEIYGYECDDPPTRFFLRDLDDSRLPADGCWRRYDLGRVRLGQARFVLDLPAGAIVEFAYCEMLMHGRVHANIALSGGPCCNMDHYVAHGGRQEFMSLSPRGGRYLEVHILAAPGSIAFIDEHYSERCYYGEPEGFFSCADQRLNQVWSMGVETYRACAEDAVTDTPTRERGQWLGDAFAGMATAAAAYADLRLFRRSLIHATLRAREDGVVNALTPYVCYVSTYAAQFINACVEYVRCTGDCGILEELFEPAVKNLSAFVARYDENNLDAVGWGFVDWGYERDPALDVALHLHYLSSLRAMIAWCCLIGRNERLSLYQDQATRVEAQVGKHLRAKSTSAGIDWNAHGYHAAALSLSNGLLGAHETRHCIEAIKRHILDCFPNNQSAPRLSDPGRVNRRLITPYFASFVFPALIEHGETDFVLDQYRTCWGWMLDNGWTTCIEVFDPRWSHCHQWSACPTGQLSRYVLGLHPRCDLGPRRVVLDLRPGSLMMASGRVPLLGGAPIEIAWQRTGTDIDYRIITTTPFELQIGFGGPVEQIRNEKRLLLPTVR
jgi:alpha-L-rhamnosidase